MIKRLTSSPTINLARTESDPALMVDLEAFFDFSFWMAEELQDLICMHQLHDKPRQTACDSHQALGFDSLSSSDQFDSPYENWVEWE